MLEFHPRDPFPLLPALAPDHYASSKRHAAAVDEWLGLNVGAVEAKLRDPGDGEQRWIDRHASVFLTPYVELRAWLERLRPRAGETVVDLGAGYGRLGFVLARHFPEAIFAGFEIVPERVVEGAQALARFGARNARLTRVNIADPAWIPPPAEIYFIYDYGSRESIAKTLGDLREISREKNIRVVGRGRGVRDQIERTHPWLGSVHRPAHFGHYSIYRSFAEDIL